MLKVEHLVKVYPNGTQALRDVSFEVHRGDRIAIITNAGGPGTILTDLIVGKGRPLCRLSDEEIARLSAILPQEWSHNNPIDIIGDACSQRFEAALNVVDTIETVGIVLLLVTPQMMTDTLAIAQLAERSWKKPLYPIFLGGEKMGEALEYLRKRKIPVFTTLEECASWL